MISNFGVRNCKQGGYWGGGGSEDGRLLPHGFDPLPTQRVPLCTILKFPFLVTHSKNFLKAPLVPIYINLKSA